MQEKGIEVPKTEEELEQKEREVAAELEKRKDSSFFGRLEELPELIEKAAYKQGREALEEEKDWLEKEKSKFIREKESQSDKFEALLNVFLSKKNELDKKIKKCFTEQETEKKIVDCVLQLDVLKNEAETLAIQLKDFKETSFWNNLEATIKDSIEQEWGVDMTGYKLYSDLWQKRSSNETTRKPTY